MKYSKIFLSLALSLLALQNSKAQNIGIGTTTPDSNAILHLESESKGFLMPRLTDAAMTMINDPAVGLAVFNTDSNAIFVFVGPTWKKLISTEDIPSVSAWNLNGNSGTTASDFIGTLDNQPLTFKTNNTISGHIGLAGNNRTSLGYNALALDNGVDNSAFGFGALAKNNLGTGNTAFGSRALANIVSGNNNVAVGTSALQNSIGSNNTASGFSALSNNSNGNINSAFGTYALAFNTVGTENEAFGYGALLNNTAACGNVAVGNLAMFNQSFNNSNFIWLTMNTAIGYHSLYSNQPTNTFNANRNTAVGANAMFGNSTGFNNTALGANSMLANSVGSNNTIIGALANVGSNNLINATAIGANAIVNTSNSFVLGNNQNVGIGTSAPLYKLHVAGVNTPTEALIESDTNFAAMSIATKNGKDAITNYSNYVNASTKTNRWQIGKNAAKETGANVGSDFTIKRYNDAGILIDEPVAIERSSGVVNINATKLNHTRLALNTVNASYTMNANDHVILYNGVNTGDILTLPIVPQVGQIIKIINHGVNAVLTQPSFENGNMSTTDTVAAGSRIELIYSGTNWILLK